MPSLTLSFRIGFCPTRAYWKKLFMPPLVTKRNALLALALALSTTVSAHAQSASASASLGKLRIELIDLDPADGVAPKLTLAAPENVSNGSSAYVYSPQANLSDYHLKAGASSAAINFPQGQASSSATGMQLEAAANYANPLGGSTYVSSEATGYVSFKLTRATRMIVTVDASVSGDGDGGRNKTKASAGLSGQFDDERGIWISDSLAWTQGREDDELSISMETLYGSLYGWLWITAKTELTFSASALPVPEPAAPAMLLAGLTVLAGYARKKARQAA